MYYGMWFARKYCTRMLSECHVCRSRDKDSKTKQNTMQYSIVNNTCTQRPYYNNYYFHEQRTATLHRKCCRKNAKGIILTRVCTDRYTRSVIRLYFNVRPAKCQWSFILFSPEDPKKRSFKTTRKSSVARAMNIKI